MRRSMLSASQLFRLTRLLQLLFICVFCTWLSACAGKQNARQLSKAQIRGLELHQSYDQKIYGAYEKSLKSELAFLAAAQREQLEAIRQKYLAKGGEELSATLTTNLGVLDKELGSSERLARDRINTALTTYSAKPSDDNFKKLVSAIDLFYGGSESFSTFRSGKIAGYAKSTTDAFATWRTTVNASVDSAIKEIDDTEGQTSAALEQTSSQLQTLRQHYDALLAGQEQIDQYLNQKTAVQLTLEGVLRGFGLQLPNVNVDSALDSLVGAAQLKMQGVADRLTSKLGEQNK